MFAWLPLLAGCSAPPPVNLDTAGVAPSADVADLAAVLARAVTEDGRLDPSGLRAVADRLDRQLRAMAVTGPTATPELYPTYGARWAYWYNARTAWSLRLVALLDYPRSADPKAIRRRSFPLDGRRLSLDGLDALLLAAARQTGDFLLACCAPCVSVGFAPLPRRPYSAPGFQDRLREEFNRFLRDERRFVIDIRSRQVRVPPMLWACRDIVIRQYHQDYGTCTATLLTALHPHVDSSARRRLEDGLGFRIVPQRPREELAIPGPLVYYSGKIGRVESP